MATGLTENDAQQFHALIGRLMSADNEDRRAAEDTYREMKESHPETAILSLLHVICFSGDAAARSMCAVLLRQEVLVPTGEEDETWSWRSISPTAQDTVKEGLMSVVQKEEVRDVRRKVVDVLAALAVSVLSMKDNSWPGLFPFLLELSKSENQEIRLASIDTFGYIANRIPTNFQEHLQDFIQFVQTKLADPYVKVRVSAMGVVYGLLSICSEPPQSTMLQAVVPGVMDSVAAAVQSDDEDAARLSIEFLTEICDFDIAFVRPNILAVIQLLLKIARTDNIEEGVRHLSVECMVTIIQAKPAMVRKIPEFLNEFFALLLNWATHLEENPDWNQGPSADLDDADAAVSEEALDRAAMCLGGETVSPILFSAVPTYLSTEDWRFRHAGLMAISVTAEGSLKYLSAHLQDVVTMILPFFKDPHPRVRWTACQAIGQLCSDFQPHIQISFHQPILSATIEVLGDSENPRVQSHAASTITNFCEDCQPEVLAPYLSGFLEKFHGLLRSPRIVQEQVLTAVASIADCVGLEFTPYYDYFVPFLKDVLTTATSSEFNVLRSKAMECISIIGVAVGKDKFGGDAQDVIKILSQIQFQPNDPEMPSMQLAWARLCKCLGKDFAPYLEATMPALLELARIDPEMEIVDSENVDKFEDDEAWDILPFGDKTVCIKTSAVEEKSTAISIIFCFVDELKEAFFQYVQPVAEIVVPCLTFGFHDGVRSTAASTMPCLIASTQEYLAQNGQEGNTEPVNALWNFIQPKFLLAMQKEIEVTAHVSMLDSYSECIDMIGEASHNPESLKSANETLHTVLEKYLKARDYRAKDAEEDFDEFEAERLEDQNEREDEVVGLVAETIGKFFKLYKGHYLPFFAEYATIWKQMMVKSHRPRDAQIATCIFDDIGEHLEGDCTSIVQDLFPVYCNMVMHNVADVRQASVFGLGVFAQFCGQAFGPSANTVANSLCQMISDPSSRLSDNIHATENAISALGKICIYQADAVNVKKFCEAFLSYLPTQEDKEESKIIYGNLCKLVETRGPDLLGAGFEKLPHLLTIFGSILGTELVDDVVTEQIVRLIKGLVQVSVFQEACGSIPPEAREKIVAAINM